MIKSLSVLGIISFVILVGDAIWLNLATEPVYAPLMGDYLSDTIQPIPAIGFYLLFVLGLWSLIVMPALKAGLTHGLIAWRSVFFGLCCYGTYDLTVWALFDGWDWRISLIDMAWGMSIAGLAGFSGSLVHNLNKS